MNRWIWILSGIIFLLPFGNRAFSQSGIQSGFGVNVYGGYLAAHHDYLQQLESHIKGVEFRYSFARHPKQAKPWETKMRLPRSGIALLWIDQGNPELTGHAFALVPHQEFRMFSFGTGSIYFRLGTGIAALTKRYHPTQNRKQIAIGAHVNPVMQFSFVWHHKIGNNWETDLGIGLTHFSNGNFDLPNYGVNLPNLHLGITRIQGYHHKPIKAAQLKHRKTLEFDLSMNGATKQEGIASFVRYGIGGVSFRYQMHRNSLSRIFFGLDIFADYSYLHRSKSNPSFTTVGESGITLGHRLMMGRLSLFTEIGVYSIRPDLIKRPWYQRIGLNYFTSPKWYFGLYLKTHLSISDYVQFTVGRILTIRK